MSARRDIIRPITNVRGAGGFGGGKGGGGGGSRPAQEAPNTLRSEQTARIVDLISEGEIHGLIDGAKSIFLDGTPLQNDDDTYNFASFSYVERFGTQAQDHATGFSASEQEVQVSSQIVFATPVVRAITNSNVDAIRVTVSVGALFYQNPSSGDMTGTSVQLKIELDSGGGYVEAFTDTIEGKTTSRYQRSYYVDLNSVPKPVNVRVSRLTADATGANIRDETFWDSYTEIIEAKFTYPNSAYVAFTIGAQQFNSIPKRTYHVRGIKLNVPSNYDPITRVYTGEWDGTFQTAWSNNPAWVFYDIVTNPRYGVGDYVDEALVDKWALYAIAQYCDELVDDGFGNDEPRFECNVVLNQATEAYSVLNALASVFRGMIYWAGGAVVPTQDRPGDVAAIYSNANVIGGVFTYEGADVRSRHTVATVSWQDPENLGQTRQEYVEDLPGILRYGVQRIDLSAFACTSRAQAVRLARWTLYTDQNEGEIVRFSVGLDGALVSPGEVIQIADRVRAGTKTGGRVMSAPGVNTIQLDRSITIPSGPVSTISCLVGDDAHVETRDILTDPGTATVLLTEPFTEAPIAGALWVVTFPTVEPTTWKVLALAEGDKDGTVDITAISHNPSKYDYIENGTPLEEPPTSVILTRPEAVSDITLFEELYAINAFTVGARAVLSWSGIDPFYDVRWRRENEGWNFSNVSEQSIVIPVDKPGIYEFGITAVNALGVRGPETTFSSELLGTYAPPSDVTGFGLQVLGTVAHFTWNVVPDLDVQVGGYYEIRWSPDDDATWGSSIPVLTQVPGSASSAEAPMRAGTWLIKAVDGSGVFSVEAARIVSTWVPPEEFFTITAFNEDPYFFGVKTQTVVSAEWGGLIIGDFIYSGLIDDQDIPMDVWPDFDVLPI